MRIEVNSASDAFMLFESLNNRGVPLSAIDLIKNKLLSEIEFSGKSIDEAFDRWKRFINNLDDFTIQERFLRQYYNSFKYKPSVKIDNITKATKSNLIDIYEKLIDRNLEFIFKDLEDKAKIYSRLINYENDDFYNELRGIDNVKAAPSYTFLLYLFSLNTDQTLLRSVINNLVKYFVRRNITDYPGTRNLDQIFIDLIELLSEDPSRINNEYISNYLFNPIRFSSLDTFKSKLEGNIYEINNDAARFLLTNIEERYSGTRERNIDFWERDKNGKLIWTIEHIFPEGSNIPTSWVNMIAGGDVEKAKEMQQKLVHKLGNLTLSGFNTNLSNSDFIKKRDLVDSSGRYIGYKNGLFLNKSLKEAEFWTEEGIIKRTSDLIEKIIEMYSIPNEK